MRFHQFQRFLAPLLLLACFALAWRPLGPEDDFWAHAAVGRWIVEHRSAPVTGLFLWGSEPTPWVAHSWLTQTVFYALMQAGGGWTPRGATSVGNGPFLVIVFTTTIIAAVFALLWRRWSHHARAGMLAIFLFSVAFFLSALRFHPRPELFSALLLTILLNFLLDWRATHSCEVPRVASQPAQSGTRWAAWRDWGTPLGIAAMFALWTNLHGAVAIGLMVLILAAICDVVQFHGDTKSRRLIILAVACIAATALNPYGFSRYWTAVLGSSQSATFGKIREWLPPLSSVELRDFLNGGAMPALLLHVLTFFFLALCGFLLWRANRERRWAEISWIVLMTVLFLQQRRHMWLAAIVCLAIIAHNIACIDERRLLQMWNERVGRAQQTPLPVLHRALIVFAASLMAVVFSTRLVPPNSWQIVSPRPDAACYALEQHFKNQRVVRVFGDYETSSYLQWRLSSRSEDRVLDGATVTRFPLYIDLLNAYPDVVTQRYIQILKGDESLLSTLGAQAVILSATQRQSAIAKELNSHSHWRHLYHGTDGDLWVLR